MIAVANWHFSNISFVGAGAPADINLSLENSGEYFNVSGGVALNRDATLFAVSANGLDSRCPVTRGFRLCILIYKRTSGNWFERRE